MVPDEPEWKGPFESFGIQDWAMHMNQNKNCSRFSDLKGLYGSNGDLSLHLNEFNSFFEEFEENNTEEEMASVDLGFGENQRNQNWTGFQILPKKRSETLESPEAEGKRSPNKSKPKPVNWKRRMALDVEY